MRFDLEMIFRWHFTRVKQKILHIYFQPEGQMLFQDQQLKMNVIKSTKNWSVFCIKLITRTILNMETFELWATVSQELPPFFPHSRLIWLSWPLMGILCASNLFRITLLLRWAVVTLDYLHWSLRWI